MSCPARIAVVTYAQASFSGKLPKKPRNQDVRSREYLTEKEVDKLMVAAKATFGQNQSFPGLLCTSELQHNLPFTSDYQYSHFWPEAGVGGLHCEVYLLRSFMGQ